MTEVHGRRNVAIIHDWLTGMRGGEKVLEALCERFPTADIFTLVHVKGSVSPAIERHRIHTSMLQFAPGIRGYYRECLPLFPILIEDFDLDDFDLVISSSHCVSKSVVVRPDALHICYCHTPMRYAWDQFDAYFGPARVGRIPSAVMRVVMRRLARWDRDTSGRPNLYVTNSQHVATRIRRYYNRHATVIHPPVDTAFFTPPTTPAVDRRYALVVSALVPYKRVDVAIDACRQARVPLRIVGDGPERSRLERGAGNDGNVTFLGRQSDAAIRELYRNASVALMPGEEDFGIVPVEAQACGTPVVALGRGGALETVVQDETGILVDELSSSAFAEAMTRAARTRFDSAAIRAHAERFGRERFMREISALVEESL